MSVRSEPRLNTCKIHTTTHLRAGGVCPLCERIGRGKLSAVKDAGKTQGEVETVQDETTISISGSDPIPFSEFERRVDALTGECLGPAQMTLGAMFKQYEAPNVRVNSSGGHVLSLETLRDMTESKPLVPGMAVECTFSGYICGAGLKWKKGGEGKEANLNINLDDLLILRVMGEVAESDPEQGLQDWEDEHDV